MSILLNGQFVTKHAVRHLRLALSKRAVSPQVFNVRVNVLSLASSHRLKLLQLYSTGKDPISVHLKSSESSEVQERLSTQVSESSSKLWFGGHKYSFRSNLLKM